jgi:hypothetical protein
VQPSGLTAVRTLRKQDKTHKKNPQKKTKTNKKIAKTSRQTKAKQ